MADTDSNRETARLVSGQELADLRAKEAMFDTLASAVELAPAELLDGLKLNRFDTADRDKVFRLIQVLSAAAELFEGDTVAAYRWLTRPAKGLGGELPINMLATSDQSNAVLDLIGKLEHGVVV